MVEYSFYRSLSNTDIDETSFALGIEFVRDGSRGLFGLSQRSCRDQLFNRLNMQNCLPGEAPRLRGNKYSISRSPKTVIAEDS